jgi:hypothetical protein
MFRVILTTISATIIIIVFSASIFLNGILNIFGLAKISLESLNSFHQSTQTIKQLKTKNAKLKNANTKYKQKNNKLNTNNTAHKQKINTIKDRHQAKNLNISKKFVKRSSNKIASSAVAAATIGTAGVVLTIAGLEIYDYCDDKRELLNDENILFDTNKEFNYTECLQSAKDDSAKIITLMQKSAPKTVYKAWQETKNFSQDKWSNIKTGTNDLWNQRENINQWTKDKWNKLF